MDGSYQHRMLCIKSPISSKVSWQDTLWVVNVKKSDVSFFRVFGCKCYIYKKQQHLGKSKAYRVFNHATGLVEETYDVEFDESNGSQGAHENLDDVGDEPLKEAMKNIPVGDIKPKDDEDDVQVIDHSLHQLCHKMVKKMWE